MFRSTRSRTAAGTASSTPAADSTSSAAPTRSRRLRRLAAGAVLTAGTAGLVAAGAGVASANPTFTTHLTPDNTFFLQLDVSGASTAPGAPVIDWYSNGGANQVWTFVDQGGGNYEIVNQNSGQCLTTDGVAGDQLYQFYCLNGPGQRWQTGLTGNPADAFVAKNIYNPAYGLDVDVYGDSAWPGAAIDAWYPNGGYNQSFGID